VPGPGDADGSGTIVVRYSATNDVCYDLTVKDIDPPTAVQLRRGRAGVAGDVALALKAPAEGSRTVSACTAADAVLLADLQAAPADFHVLVSSETFPKGALRGQLR
jgi:hypothetical protein